MTLRDQLLEAFSTASDSIKGREGTQFYHEDSGVPQHVMSAVSELSGSFMVLDLDAFRANAADMAARAQETPIRVASKSLRIPAAIREALAQDGFSGVLAFSLREAIWLVKEGVCDDVLVAYTSTDREALSELAADEGLARAITITVDSVDHLNFIDAATDAESRCELRLCLDIDASLVIGRGMYIPGLSKGDTSKLWENEPVGKRSVRIGALRSPIHGVRDAQRFVRQVWKRTNMKVVGILAYEGQIAGEPDGGTSVRKTMVRIMQSLSRGEIASRRHAIVDGVNYTLLSAGLDQLEFVNGGGTGSLESTGAEECVTEIGAGSGLIGSGLFDHYRSFRPHHAEWFVVPVVRRPGKGVVTVAGGGRVASGVPGEDRLPTVDYPEGLRFASHEGAGEVQTPLIGKAADSVRIGSKVWLRHAKAGEAAEWANEVVVVSEGKIVDRWKTYRGEGLCF